MKKSGFEKATYTYGKCYGLDHKPPTGLIIFPGEQYRHICSVCGKETVMHANTKLKNPNRFIK